MKKEYDFSKARRNPYANHLKRQVTIRLNDKTRSSGNLFRDLGLDRPEAAHLLIRSELMIRLRKVIEAQGLTQAKAAKMLHVSQLRVSALMKGRIDLFSVDTLIDMLDRAGFTVKVALTKSPPRKVA